MQLLFIITLLLCDNLNFTFGLRILGVFPHPGKSHVDVFLTVMRGLAEKGHNVTVLSYFPSDEPMMRYRDVSLKDNFDPMVDNVRFEEVYPESRMKRYLTAMKLRHLAETTCESGMTSEEFKRFFRSPERYDIMLIELFNTDCFIGLAEKYQAEVIGLSSCTIMSWYHGRFGNPSHTAYIPNNLLTFSDQMSFWERFENTVITLLHQMYYNQITLRSDKRIAKELLGTKSSDLDKVIKKIRLFLVNTHISLNLPKPLAPNVIEIGGIHVNEPKPLSKNLEKWISESKHGVIYFSMGSLLKGHTLPKEKRDAFLKAFARLPQRVLWKWENDSMEDQPDNVMIQKWMPQFDILSHPNVKAFISHGGLLGTIEAVHCGVPIVVMPQFGDQHTNAKAIEANGGGVILLMNDVTEETVYDALSTVLTPVFRRKAKQLSERFRDRPMPPLDTAIYWIEYVARHKGAPHLRTAAVDMPFYQYYLLDVFAFLFSILFAFIYSVYLICKTVIRLFRRKSVVEKEKSS